MTHHLRMMVNGQNTTIVDCEETKDDVHVVVCIKGYSNLLLSVARYHQLEVIDKFDQLQELRGEWFEKVGYFKEETLPDFVKRRFKEVADRFNLYYSTD